LICLRVTGWSAFVVGGDQPGGFDIAGLVDALFVIGRGEKTALRSMCEPVFGEDLIGLPVSRAYVVWMIISAAG